MKCSEMYQIKQNLQRKYTEVSKCLFGKYKCRLHTKVDGPSEQNPQKQASKFDTGANANPFKDA
jgi:hypothetical protein